MFLKPFQIFHRGQSLVSGFLLRLDCGRPEGRSKQVLSFNCNLCESIYSFYTDYTLWREKKSVHLIQKLSLFKAGCSPVIPVPWNSCHFHLWGQFVFRKRWPAVSFCLPQKHLLRCDCEHRSSSHQYTAAEAFLGGGVKSQPIQWIYDRCYEQKFNLPREPQAH